MKLLVSLLIQTVAVFVTAYVLPGIEVRDWFTAFVVAVVLGVVNTFIRPILILLTLPINVVTLGLFLLVINGLLILLTSAIVPGFAVSGFLWAVIFSLVLSLISSFLNHLAK